MANEKRLIDANELKCFVCETCNAVNSDEPCEPSDCRCMLLIDEMPTVDAVEVVRCKDCKWAKPSHKGWVHCTETDIILGNEEFCSCGERRAGE